MENPITNIPLTDQELNRVSNLTESEIKWIDKTIIACTHKRYLKQARVVIQASEKVEEQLNGIPFTYYSLRIQELVKNNLLESIGDLNIMRFSEIRKVK